MPTDDRGVMRPAAARGPSDGTTDTSVGDAARAADVPVVGSADAGAVATPLPSRGRLATTFAALRHRNYRLWFVGQTVSILGSWMQTTAQGYLVYELTHSTTYLGFVGFAAGVPSWLFTLWGGVVADRVSRRLLLMVTQSAMMLLAFALAALTFADLVRPWHIVGLALGLGVANAFDAPARQAFVVELVDRGDLTNAIALNSTMFNIGTTIGPASAGLVYAALGPAWCFGINGLSFIAVITALGAMRLVAPTRPATRGSAGRELADGLRFTLGHRVIRTLILGVGMTTVCGLAALMTLMPAWATTVLGGDARTNGLLLSARGLGSLIGAMMVASVGAAIVRGRWNLVGSLVTPVALVVFAQLHSLPASAVALVISGWAFMVYFNTSNALVQMHVPDALRGRVMGIYSLAFFGLIPVGALLAGALAAVVGPAWTIVGDAVVLLGWVVFTRLRVPEIAALR